MITIIPHFKNIGGSGKYISEVIDILISDHEVNSIGPYEYNCVCKNKNFNCILFPNYEGVSFIKSFYIFIKSFFINKFLRNNESVLADSNLIIFTSSIQMPTILFNRKFYKSKKIIFLVQENFKFNVISKLMFFFFHNNVYFVSITDLIHRKFKNNFNNRNLIMLNNSFTKKNYEARKNKYDLLYIGGESKIKGFDFLKHLVESDFFVNNKLSAKFIGFNKVNCNELYEPYSKDIGQDYHNCKILFLPLKTYHFMRPAIEAGLLGVPFIISDCFTLDGLSYDDYIFPGLNCEIYQSNNIHSLLLSIEKILKNYDAFSKNSCDVAEKFVSEYQTQVKAFKSSIKCIIYE